MTVLFYLAAFVVLVLGAFRGAAAFRPISARRLAAFSTFWISMVGLCLSALWIACFIYVIATFDERIDSPAIIASVTFIAGRGAMLCAALAVVGHLALSAVSRP